MPGLTPAGLEIRTQPEVQERIEAALAAALPGVNVRVGPLQQLTGIVSEEIAIVWEALQAVHSATDRASASDRALDRVGALTGTLRRPATRSTVIGTVRLAAATTLPAGALAAVRGEPDSRFRTTADAVNPAAAPADVDVELEGVETGPVAAPSGTLTVIVAPVGGWISITNALDAELGAEVEDDVTYRRRQLDELTASGGGTVDAIRADLLRVADVRAVRVFENVLDVVSPEGMPPHSVEAVVLDGLDQDIAEQLWRSKPAGIETHGPIAVVVDDSAGDPHTIRFSRPVERPVRVWLNVRVDPERFPTDGVAQIQTRIAELGDREFGVGDDVIRSRYFCVVLDVDGVEDVSPLLHAFVPGGFTTANLAIGRRELATFDSSRVTVIVTPV